MGIVEKKHVWGCSNYSWIISQLCGSISAILTPYWLNCEHVCECVTGSEGELKRGDKLHGYIWVREIKICAVCDHFPCQYNHASQPPFTFYPVIPTSPSLPALTRTSQAGIIELTTLWDRHPPPPPSPNPVTPCWVEGSRSDSVLPPLWPPRVWFCSGYSGSKSQKLISPSDVAQWLFLEVIEALLSSPPLLGCIPLTKRKYFYHCSVCPCCFLHLHHYMHPPLLSAAQDRQRKKHSLLKIENISSASNHSDSLSWGVTLSEAFDSTFKNKLQLQPAILGSTWGHSTPHPETIKWCWMA